MRSALRGDCLQAGAHAFCRFFFALLSGADRDGAPKKGFTICSCNCAARYAIINNKENRAAIFPGWRQAVEPRAERGTVEIHREGSMRL